MNEATDSITLRLEGTRAKRGVALSDFETFIENFISALRDFDRDRTGRQTRKPGHPEARAEAVTAFRLVAFREGSGIATIEPDLGDTENDGERMVEAEPIQVANLCSLLSVVEKEEPLPESVGDALEKAIRTAGDDGCLSVDFAGRKADRFEGRSVTIDLPRIKRIRSARETVPPKVVTSISGRLHQVDFEPDRLAIRTSDGVDWSCDFSETLEQQVEALVNRLVWASGDGTLQSPQRGKMELIEIKGIEQGLQAGLFSGDPVSDEDLAAAQGVTGPQGLDAIAANEWTDEDDAFLAALTDD
ncbi:MAG TPA: hypothetical protein VLL27_00515 [Solirubrobacterales bacterium]|nr:hypothetical protein [Solirubrobacterales bacterium]